ncbi:MAG: ArgE/DapE family deacylase [Myxococcota bacterium]
MNSPGTVDARRVRGRLVDLVRIPSLGGAEDGAVARLAHWLEQMGVEVDHWREPVANLQHHPDYPGHEIERALLPVVAARVRGARPGPTVLLTGHVDVAPTGDWEQWTHEPFSGRVYGDRVYGRGACDMKSGIVAALEAFELLARSRREFGGQVLFIAVSAEEDSGAGTLAAIQRGYDADAAILPEPTVLEGEQPTIVAAQAGAMTMRITVPGRGAHASRRREGENALAHFLPIHRALLDEEARVNARETDPLMGDMDLPYCINVGVIRGGSWPSTVMESVEVDLRVGIALWESPAEAAERIRRVVREAGASNSWLVDNPPRVDVVATGFGSARVASDHAVVTTLAGVSEQVFGRTPDVSGVPFACDMSGWVRLAGVPTVLYGPGDLDLAHGADEWASLSRTCRVARVLHETTCRLLDDGEEPILRRVGRQGP